MADDPKKQKAESMKDKAKGKAKEAAGAVTDDERQKAEGEMDQAKGEAKEKAAEAREKVDKNT